MGTNDRAAQAIGQCQVCLRAAEVIRRLARRRRLTIVGGVRERFVVTRRGRLGTVCASALILRFRATAQLLR
jgi:hypothetical protein